MLSPSAQAVAGCCVQSCATAGSLFPHFLTPACPCLQRRSRFSGLVQQENHSSGLKPDSFGSTTQTATYLWGREQDLGMPGMGRTSLSKPACSNDRLKAASTHPSHAINLCVCVCLYFSTAIPTGNACIMGLHSSTSCSLL